MNDSQRNKLSMFLAVLGVMETYESLWNGLPAIQSLVTRLGDLTADIQTKSGVQGTSRTGIAQGKNRKQVEMVNLTLDAAGDLHAYAVDQQDDTLAGQTDVEPSDLLRLADARTGFRAGVPRRADHRGPGLGGASRCAGDGWGEADAWTEIVGQALRLPCGWTWSSGRGEERKD